jgi:hypothetical protein
MNEISKVPKVNYGKKKSGMTLINVFCYFIYQTYDFRKTKINAKPTGKLQIF